MTMNYFKIGWTLLLIAGAAQLCQGQDVKIQGAKISLVVLDAQNSRPMEGATLYIENTFVGTVTNQQGICEIPIPDQYQKDTLTISFMGFQTKKISILELSRSSLNRVLLEPSALILEEVVIQGESELLKILDQIRNNIILNYPQSPYSAELFYRHKKTRQDSIEMIEEAALDFYDEKGYKPDAQGKILQGRMFQVKQLRESTARKKNEYVALHDLPVFWSSDPILSQNNILGKSNAKSYKLELEGTKKFGKNEVMEISFECTDPNVNTTGLGFPAPKSFTGKIFVDVKSHAIIRFETRVVWNARLVKDLKFLKRFGITNVSNFDRSATSVYNYKQVGNTYFLHFARRTDTLIFSPEKNPKDQTTLIYDNQLLFNTINVREPRKLTESKLQVDSKDIPYDKKFWDEFSFITEGNAPDKKP